MISVNFFFPFLPFFLIIGVIDIPIVEGLIDGRRRMVLCPDVPGFKIPSGNRQQAITEFKVCLKRRMCECVLKEPFYIYFNFDNVFIDFVY